MPAHDSAASGPARSPQLLTAIRLLRGGACEPRTRGRGLLAICGIFLLTFPWLAIGTAGDAARLGHMPAWVLEPLVAALALAGLTLQTLHREWQMPSAEDLLHAFNHDSAAGARPRDRARGEAPPQDQR